MTCKRVVLLAAVGVILAVEAFGGIQGARAWWAWRRTERVEFDTAEAPVALPALPDVHHDSSSGAIPESTALASPTPTYEVVQYDTVLAIGSDERSAAQEERHPGVHADPGARERIGVPLLAA